jgi:hypothetical protein
MRIDEKFNLKAAPLVETFPVVQQGRMDFALGMCVEFRPMPGEDRRALRLHLTPLEALEFAQDLIEAARKQLQQG